MPWVYQRHPDEKTGEVILSYHDTDFRSKKCRRCGRSIHEIVTHWIRGCS